MGHPLGVIPAATFPISFEGDALEVLRRAALAHVGVQGAQGPHVTPQGYVWFRERIWLLTPRASFKARVLAKRPEAGVLLEDDSRHVYLSGRAAILDPLDASTLKADPVAAALLPAAFAAYLKKNVYESVSAARRKLGVDVWGMPVTRVAVVIKPERFALMDHDGLVEGGGDWDRAIADDIGAPETTADLDDLPDEFFDMAVTGRHLAVVGWGGTGAPLIVPGCWDGDKETAEVDSALLDLAMASSNADACVTLDNEIGPGLGAKRGVVLRGSGVAEFDDGKASITLDATKVHYWAGTRAGSLAAPEAE